VQNRSGYDWSRLVNSGSDDSAVSDRAEGTFMTREFGIVCMDVNGLGKAAQSNQEDSQKSQRSGELPSTSGGINQSSLDSR
jgi:hypothetical protein